jgi:hypothetical protein
MGKILNVVNHVLKNGYEYETSAFGPRKDPISGADSYHNGEDMISSKYGTDSIVAFQAGTVEALRNSVAGYDKVNGSGNYIHIRHDGGHQSRYLHLKKDSLTVKVGQAVRKGEVIAYMGSTGYSTGAHLHFEVRLDGNPQDPVPYLSGEKSIPADIPDSAVPSAPVGPDRIGDTVYFKGGNHFANAQADTPTGGIRSAGKAKVTGLASGKPHPYHLIGEKGGSNVYGWVNADAVSSTAQSALPPVTAAIRKGDRVRIKPGAKWYNGKAIPAWVMADTWIVYENPKDGRAVLDSNASGRNHIMSPISTNYLTKA